MYLLYRRLEMLNEMIKPIRKLSMLEAFDVVFSQNIRLKTTSKASLKKQLKEYFWKEFLKDPKVTDIKDDIESIRF